MQSPGKYWRNNVDGTVALVEAAMRAGVRDIVFSSSCSVYGTPAEVPVVESAPIAARERVRRDQGDGRADPPLVRRDQGVALGEPALLQRRRRQLRRAIGEDWTFSINLIPLVMKAVLGAGPPVQVFGDDYPTPDGTCIRDYIHVDDLADAHVRALDRLSSGLPDGASSVAVNLGTGVGSSVLDVIEATEAVAGRPVPHEIVGRRAGDPVAHVRRPDVRRDRTRLAGQARARRDRRHGVPLALQGD